MVRIKRGTTSLKHRKNLLQRAKGFRWGRSHKERLAREAVLHAGNHAFAHRRKKKGDFRRLWNVCIGAAAKLHNSSYSKLIGTLHSNGCRINRKMLCEIAQQRPETFKKIVNRYTK